MEVPVADRQRVAQRRAVARVISRRLEALAEKTRWNDDRYTELEADVEIQGGRERLIAGWGRSPTRANVLRYERSLTRALARSVERLILVQGEPGSGKSVALRHLAGKLAAAAQRSPRRDALIPLYVDLKGFRPPASPDGPDADAVRDYVLRTVTGVKNKEIGRILVDEGEFDQGLREGSWLLLFDSFDEIPDVLAATESDATIRAYADAIREFAQVSMCRAVIASREYRGPPSFHLPVMTIKRLDADRQAEMIRRSGLDAERRRTVADGIALADPDLRQLAGNPLFLWLLCEYLRINVQFPEHAHAVYASYVDHRLGTDSVRLAEQFALFPDELRDYAEEIAFQMAAHPGLGLAPTRRALHAALAGDPHSASVPMDTVVDALGFLRLGRDEATGDDPPAGEDISEQRFTFTHRRLQEYFATCAVLRAPDRVAFRDLLTDGHWRETAITILQLQSAEAAAPLLDAARVLLHERIGAQAGDNGLAGAMTLAVRESGDGPDAAPEPGTFAWPPGVLHVLELLAIGMSRAPGRIPEDIRAIIGSTLERAWRDGRRHERLWTLDVVLGAPESAMTEILTDAFASSSSLLREAAFRQAAWLPDLAAPVRLGLRRALFTIWASRRLRREGTAVRVQLRRFGQAPELLQAYWLLWAVFGIDLLLVSGACALAATAGPRPHALTWWSAALGVAVAHCGLLIRRDGLAGAVLYERPPPLVVAWARLAFRSPQTRRLVGRSIRVGLLAALLTATAVRVPPHGVRGWTIAVGIGLAALYALAWADTAMDQVVLGGAVRPLAWPALPALRVAGRHTGRIGFRVDERYSYLASLVVFMLIIAAFGTACTFVFLGVAWVWHVAKLGLLFSWVGPTLHWIGHLFAGWHVPHWIPTVLHWTGLVIGYGFFSVFAFVFVGVMLLEGGRVFFKRGGDAIAIRRGIRAAATRTEPYTADEIVADLLRMASAHTVRAYVRTLRERPQLCEPGAVTMLSDVATAAETGGHQRYISALYSKGRRIRSEKKARVALPADHGAAFAAWVKANERQAAYLLTRLDEETIDEITRLVAECRRADA
jgi:hypothetical protein